VKVLEDESVDWGTALPIGEGQPGHLGDLVRGCQLAGEGGRAAGHPHDHAGGMTVRLSVERSDMSGAATVFLSWVRETGGEACPRGKTSAADR